MKILIHGINFAPEPVGIGKYSSEMADRLVTMGHDVRMVTAPPYYPEWKVSSGWRNTWSVQTWKGVEVWRAPLWVPEQPTGSTRVLHLLSFALLAIPSMLCQVAWRPDVVMVVAPALACAPSGWLVARLSGARTWLHVQDFEVDAAFELGFLSSHRGKTRKVITAVERWLLQRFDRVSTISRRMLDLTRAKQVPPDRLVYLPNWVDERTIHPQSAPSPYRAELGLHDDQVVALFSGTMGGKQGLELLPEVARSLARTHPHVMLVLCGNGVVKPLLESECAHMPNVRLLPLQPMERLNDLLNLADIHLLPQNANAADLVMPSKLTGMLASGRPVITTAAPGTELAEVVKHCGKVTPPGDAEALANALRELTDAPDQRQALGRAARQYAENHLSETAVLKRLESCLKACIQDGMSGQELPADPAPPPKTGH